MLITHKPYEESHVHEAEANDLQGEIGWQEE
jgi:hypothetical protein